MNSVTIMSDLQPTAIVDAMNIIEARIAKSPDSASRSVCISAVCKGLGIGWNDAKAIVQTLINRKVLVYTEGCGPVFRTVLAKGVHWDRVYLASTGCVVSDGVGAGRHHSDHKERPWPLVDGQGIGRCH